MKILLTGASGFIGGHLLQMLQQTGEEVIQIDRHSGFDFNRMLQVDDWVTLLDGIDCVINAVGIISETGDQTFDNCHWHAPVALFKACEKTSVKRVIQISALGADENAFTAFQLTKKQADDFLRSTGLEWFILRPSLVYGEGGKSSRMFQRMAALPVIPVVAGGQQLIQPVHISDLVFTIMQCLYAKTSAITLDVVGASSLYFIDWLQSMRQKQGKQPAAILSIPYALALSVTKFAQYIVPLIRPDNLRMLQQGSTADVTPLVQFIGHYPQSMEV